MMKILIFCLYSLLCASAFLGFVACSLPNEQEKPKQTVAIPEFNLAEGTYEHDINIELSCATENAVIYYSTDGSAPGKTSGVYDLPISISGQHTVVTIKTLAVKDGMIDSAIASVTYTIDNPISNIKTWSKIINVGSDTAGVFETSDNCYITGGGIAGNIYLTKFNNAGMISWEKTFDGRTDSGDDLLIYKADLDIPGQGIWKVVDNYEGNWSYANPYFITGCQDDSVIMAGKIYFNKPKLN